MLHKMRMSLGHVKHAPMLDSHAHGFASETRSLPQHVAINRVKTHLRQRAAMLHEFENLERTLASHAHGRKAN